MKSILAYFRRAKTAILAILETLNLICGRFKLANVKKIPKNFKVRATKMVKIAVLKSAIIDFL